MHEVDVVPAPHDAVDGWSVVCPLMTDSRERTSRVSRENATPSHESASETAAAVLSSTGKSPSTVRLSAGLALTAAK